MEFILIAILKNIDNKIGRAWAKSHLMITHKTGKSNYVSQKTLIERDIWYIEHAPSITYSI